MVKKIDTLIEDMNAVLEEGVPSIRDMQVVEPVLNATDAISTAVFKALDPENRKRKPSLYMSNLGWPRCKMWFHLKGYPGEEFDASTRMKFLMGDIFEEVALLLARLAGHEVKGEQDALELDGVRGRRDAVIDGYTVDVKSASPYGFEKFRNGTLAFDDPFGYIDQLAAYTGADNTVNQDAAYDLAVHKVLGKFALYRSEADEWPDMSAKIKQIRADQDEDSPLDRCFTPVPDGKSGNEKLGVSCSYCPFKEECWKDSNDGKGLRTFIYSTGPRFLTTVEREPNVPEANA